MINKVQAWGLGGVVAFLTILSLSYSMWPAVGWKTPNGHDEDVQSISDDISNSQAPVLSAIKALSTKVDVNADRWVCDEDSEELVDKLREQVVDHSIEREVSIENIRSRMSELRCNRFSN